MFLFVVLLPAENCEKRRKRRRRRRRRRRRWWFRQKCDRVWRDPLTKKREEERPKKNKIVGAQCLFPLPTPPKKGTIGTNHFFPSFPPSLFLPPTQESIFGEMEALLTSVFFFFSHTFFSQKLRIKKKIVFPDSLWRQGWPNSGCWMVVMRALLFSLSLPLSLSLSLSCGASGA